MLHDVSQVLAAVTALPPERFAVPLDRLRRAFDGSEPLFVPANADSRARDGVVYQLLALGYSAKEIADVVTGRISRESLDRAHRMLMLGQPRAAVSDYLDGAYARARERGARRRPSAPGGPESGSPERAALRALAAEAAARYGLDVQLVSAVIACESAWNSRARSVAGAIGLMQLMPATARELGIDPWDPRQNIDGGARYLASLLGSFGSLELSLVAYNAGPGFAARYLRGETSLYGETREFVRRVQQLLGGSPQAR